MPELSTVFEGIAMNKIAFVLLIGFLAILIIGFVGVGAFLWIRRKQLKHIIPLYKKVGNKTIKIGTYKARDFKVGRVGDYLWYIPAKKKYISPATIQSGANEYSHFEREDGEWINFEIGNIDEEMKSAGVKYVNQDMRATRIAIGDILEARFKNKQSFWDQYGMMITYVIFYLIVAIAMVMIFYQWSDIIEQTANLVSRLDAMIQAQNNGEPNSLVPAFIPLLLWRIKKK